MKKRSGEKSLVCQTLFEIQNRIRWDLFLFLCIAVWILNNRSRIAVDAIFAVIFQFFFLRCLWILEWSECGTYSAVHEVEKNLRFLVFSSAKQQLIVAVAYNRVDQSRPKWKGTEVYGSQEGRHCTFMYYYYLLRERRIPGLYMLLFAVTTVCVCEKNGTE